MKFLYFPKVYLMYDIQGVRIFVENRFMQIRI